MALLSLGKKRETRHLSGTYRARRRRILRSEMLEPRLLLAADPAHVFAQFTGVVNSSDEREIVIGQDDFSLAGQRTRLGFWLKADGGSLLDPAPVVIRDSNQQLVNPLLSNMNLAAGQQSLVVAELPLGSYQITVSGAQQTQGGYELDVFLVGDVDGDRSVSAADGQAIQAMLGAVAGEPHYRVEADANLDGRITSLDYSYWRTNLADSTTLQPLSLEAQFSVDTGPLAAAAAITDEQTVEVSGSTHPNFPVELAITNLAGAALSGSVDDPLTTNSDAEGNYSFSFTLQPGFHALDVRVADSFGQRHSASSSLSVVESFQITEISPANGEALVSVTRPAIVRFTEPVDPASVNSESVKVFALGAEVSGHRTVSSTGRFMTFYPDSPWSASSQVRVEVDGDLLRAANGDSLDANGDGSSGGIHTSEFSTLPLTRIPGTDVWGYVYDSYNKNPDGSNIPIVGATIRVDSLSDANAVTDTNGYFILRDMPAPDFFVHIDGTTASNAPAGMMYPSVGKPFHSVPGQSTQLIMDGTPFDIYLPPMAMGDIQPLSQTEPTQVGFGAAGNAQLAAMFPDIDSSVWDRMQVGFAPNAAVDKFGNAATEAVVIPVPPDRIPAPLPPNVNPQLVISIQAIGATSFDIPAPVTFPNLEGLAPGEKSLIFSFDHDAGRWDVIGAGTVSEDGLTIVSDPGVGIVAPGWHFVQVGTPTSGQPCTDQLCARFEGRLGDVIRIDISGTVALSDRPASESNFRGLQINGGQIARDASGNILSENNRPFSETGIFFVFPTIDQLASYDANAGVVRPTGPASITGQFTADLINASGDRDAKVGVIRVDVSPGHSQIILDGTVGQGGQNNRLDVYKVQQRLRYLNFRGQKATQAGVSPEVQVTGQSNDVLVQAIRLLQGVVVANGSGNPVNRDGRVDVGGTTHGWLGATNAPFWLRAPGTWVTAGVINHEDWATHWTLDVLRNSIATDASIQGRITSLTEYPDIAWPSGSQPHGEHKAGHDIDVGFAGNLPLNNPVFPAGTTLEQMLAGLQQREREIIDQIRAIHTAAGGQFVEVLVGGAARADGTDPQPTYPRIRQVLTALGLSNRNVRGHHDHAHISLRPPNQEAGVQGLSLQIHSFQDMKLFGQSTVPMSVSQGFGNDPRLHYRFQLSNGLELMGRSNASGTFTEILTPNIAYTLTVYQASTNHWAVFDGRSNASGALTDLGLIILDQFGGLDSDGDGIPDVGEYAIGTDPNNPDTSGDGISDSAALEMGLDPLDGRAFPTGIISSLPLPGPAEKVAVDGNRLYVASGNGGLAIVDGTQFNNPILLGQLGLPGYANSVGVDGNLAIAAVGTGAAGLQLIDVSDGMAPRLLRTVGAVPADKVEVANGLAYAVSGNALRIVDLVTGNLVQSLSLPGAGTTTGLAREGTMLYAFVSGSDTFSIIDIANEGAATVRGQVNVSIASFDVGLFVGNGIAWLSGSGLRTIDISNPTAPAIIQLPTGSEFFTARRIALNGSGLGLLLPDGGNFLQVYGTDNPNNVADLLLQFPLTGNAHDVAISRGIAYVGSGNQLDVVNYLPFDNKRIAPSVSSSVLVIDQDLVKPGLQVLEGTTIPVRTSISDDVQIRNVELLVNGQVVSNDVSFPFDFFAIAPTVAAGEFFTLQVRATDTGGNSSLSDLVTIELIQDTSAPTIVFIEPPTGASRVEPLQTVQVHFSKPMSATSVTAQTIRLRDAQGHFIAPVNFQLRDDDRFAQLTFTPLTLGDYEIIISGGVTDRIGNRLANDDFISPFSLTLRGMVQTSVVDADPAAPGIQVYEGTTVPVAVTVASGVDVQDIELLVNGQPFGSANVAPYTFSVVAPNIVPGAETMTLQARITDTAGIMTITNVVIVELLEDVTAPTIVSFEPANASTGFEGLQTLKVNFSEPLATSSVTGANFQLLEAGADETLGTGDDVAFAIFGVQFANDDSQVQLATASLPIGQYRLILDRDGITDRAGNALGTGVVETDFELQEQVLINGGFEEQFAGWMIQSSFSGLASTVSSYTGDISYAPQEGNRFALLRSGTIDVYTTVSQPFTVQAGDTVSGWAFFDTTDYLPFNDNGYVRVLSGSTVVATPFNASVASVGEYGFTDWTYWQYTFTASGTFTIQAGVRNIEDSGVDSFLGLDAIQVSRAAPEITLLGTAVSSNQPSEAFDELFFVMAGSHGSAENPSLLPIDGRSTDHEVQSVENLWVSLPEPWSGSSDVPHARFHGEVKRVRPLSSISDVGLLDAMFAELDNALTPTVHSEMHL